MLERRVTLLGDAVGGARRARPLRPRSAARTRRRRCAALSLVAANYGLPQRNLGTVSRDRPDADGLRDGDRRRARGRAAAVALRRGRLRRAPSQMPRDYYEVLGVGRERRRDRDQEGVPPARARAAPGHQPRRPGRRGEVQGGRRGLRGALRRRPPAPATTRYGHEGLRSGGYAPNFEGFGSVVGPVRGVLRRGRLRHRVRHRARPARAARCRAPTSSSRSRSTSPQAASGETVEVTYEADVRCEHCHGNGAEPGTPIVTCPRCDGTGQLQAVSRTRVRPARAHRGLRRLRRRRARPRAAVQRLRRRGQRRARSARCTSTSRRASPTASASGSAAAATPASAAARPATSTWSCACARTSASCATRRTCTPSSTSPAPLAALGTTDPGADARRATSRWTCRPGTQPGEIIALRGRGLPPLRPRPHRRPARARQRRDPAPPQPRAARPARAARRHARRRRTCARTRACWPSSGARSRDEPRAARPARHPRAERAGRAGARRAAAGAGADGVGGDASRRRARSSTRSTAPPGELPDARRRAGAPPATRSSTSRSTEVADDWDERWKRFYGPVEVAAAGRRLRVRPPWEPPRPTATALEVVIDPGERSAPARTRRRALPRAAARARAGGAAVRLGLRHRRARDRGRAARLRARARRST